MAKRIWILTMFPHFFDQFKEVGVVGQKFQGLRGDAIELQTLNISDFSPKGFKGVDSSPYGGGPGMVMRADVLKSALIDGVVKEGNYGNDYKEKLKVIFTAPRGKIWNNKVCKEFSQKYFSEHSDKDLVFICGRYEGIDERFLDMYVDEHYCIGDFVLSGGEIAVMTILDSSLRFSKGVLSNDDSAKMDSFENNLLEHPQYTRPSLFEEVEVPNVLISGDHKKINNWKNQMQVEMTEKWRPDLIDKEI